MTEIKARNGLDVRVFVSYRRRDNDERADHPGRVTQFRDRLEAAIRARTALSPHSWVFFDKDPKGLLTPEQWREKIRNRLADTTVFVSVMTANYLADDTPGAACLWEFEQYSAQMDSPGDLPRTVITLQLCRDEQMQEALTSPIWSRLGDQEILSYRQCRTAWDMGPTSSEWGTLIAVVADSIIEFAKVTPTPVDRIELSGRVTVGRPVTWSVPASSGDVPARSVQWLIDGHPRAGATDPSYTPRPEDVDRVLSARVVLHQPGHRSVTRLTPPIAVEAADIKHGQVRLTGHPVSGRILIVKVDDIAPATTEVRYSWERDGAPIEGAHDTSYLLSSDDEGCLLQARCQFSAPGHRDLEALSPSLKVRAAPPPSTVAESPDNPESQAGTDPGQTPITRILVGVSLFLWAGWVYSMAFVPGNLWLLFGCVLFGLAAPLTTTAAAGIFLGSNHSGATSGKDAAATVVAGLLTAALGVLLCVSPYSFSLESFAIWDGSLRTLVAATWIVTLGALALWARVAFYAHRLDAQVKAASRGTAEPPGTADIPPADQP